MANEEELHRCITKFILNTTQSTRNEYGSEVSLIRLCTRMMLSSQIFVGGVELIELLIAGSTAEFYIKPMLSSIGDVDVMQITNNVLAIPFEDTLPNELPNFCKNDVTYVFQIIDSHEPGYIYLKPTCIVNKNDNGSYVVQTINNVHVHNRFHLSIDQDYFQRCCNLEISNNSFIQSIMTLDVIPHGPANRTSYNSDTSDVFTPTHAVLPNVDIVVSFRCPIWPPLAADWPTRNRDHNWPDPEIMNLIVTNACDVVGAVHPIWRQDEWMNKHQWRLSFSRAEITLLNSWTPVQQIIYHMLRFVFKREVFSETQGENPYLAKLSTYHIKTLMLWECEQKPLSWWSAESSLVPLCSSLLYKFSDWVAVKRCQHYFISNGNLFDDFSDEVSRASCNKVRSLADVSVLSLWFFENYVRECAQRCPENVSKLFEDFCSSDKLEAATHAVTDWKLSTLPCERWKEDYESEKMMLSFQLIHRPATMATPMITEELRNFDTRLRDYFIAVTSLWVAYTISIHSLTEDLLEVLWTLLVPCTTAISDTATVELRCDKRLLMRKATVLAALSAVRSNALEMLHSEMSKAYLYQTLDSQHEQESTYCVAHVLLAALYYKSGQYRTATDHCKQVLNQHDRDGYRLCCIGAECLPEIDEDVSSVFGLIQFYQHIKRTTLHQNLQHQQNCKLAFTPQLLAHYLCLKCSSLADAKAHQKKYRYHIFVARLPLLGDILLFKELETPLDKCTEISVASFGNSDTRNNASCCMDTSLLVTMVELVALEKLINFRQSVVREVHCEQFPVVNEFAVLYAYRRGLFDECLEMCRKHIRMLLSTGFSQNQRVMTAMPVFLSLLDGELLSFFGVVRLSYPIVALFLLQFPESESISLLTLLLCLVFQCQKKLRSDLLCDTLQLIRYVHDDVFPANDKEYFVDRLILKMTYRSMNLYVNDSICAIG